MIKIILILMGSLLSWVATAQQEPIVTQEGYKVAIQTSAICQMCQYTLEKDLAFERGVKKATLDLDDKMMTIIYNPKKTNVSTLRERITLVGYHADTLARNPVAYDRLPICCKDGSHGTPVPQLPLPSKKNN